jgi:hypothetical protein
MTLAHDGDQPKPTFVDVARIIAKGSPPDWLVRGLEDFSLYFRLPKGDPDDLEIEKNMLKAARYLDDWLQIYLRLSEPPWNFEYPEAEAVENLSIALFEVIELLEKDINDLPRRAGGPKPDRRRLICAAVIGEAYRLLHEQLEPYSQHLQQACEHYWQACGNEPTGQYGYRRNWERNLQKYVDSGSDDWVRGKWVAHLTGPK